MFKSAPILAFAAVLVLASLACGSSGVVTPDTNFINTAVAQTFAVIQAQSLEPGIPVTGIGTISPTSTPPPTTSPTITPSPAPLFTFTPSIPQISVSVATNCRVGPGKIYNRVGGLMVGEVTEVFGRNQGGNYWYVRNPDAPGEFCWLWGEYATLSGNIQALPVYTPPPTPTPVPSFDAEYSGLETCNNTWWIEIKLKNTGGIAFKSISLTVLDKTASQSFSMTSDKFTNATGCTSSEDRKVLSLAEKFVVSSPVFNYDPAGHKLRATITLCSEDGVNGTCVTQVIEFKP